MRIFSKSRRFAPLLPRLPGLLALGCTSSPGTKPAPDAPGVLPGPIAGTTQNQLPTGWKLSPARATTLLGDLPLDLQISPDGRLAAVVNAGWGKNSVQFLNAATGQQLHAVTREDNPPYAFDLKMRKLLRTLQLPAENPLLI